VSSNRLTGDLPKELFSLPLLEILDVSNNAFTGTLSPPDGTETSNLRIVDAENNRLIGALLGSEFFKRAPYLRYLRLSNNKISGAFADDAFDNAGELVELHASNNDLLGPLPDSIRRLTKLKSLRLSGNARLGAGGGIPAALSECYDLRVVELARAGFEGDITDDVFERMHRLSSLNLAENKFSGNLPVSLKSVKFLRKLEIQNNAFAGKVPSWLVELPHLQLADLTGNKFTGTIPDSFYDNKTNSVPKLEEHRNRPAGVARVLRLGRNPLFCPLPSWARAAVGATCVRTEITSIEPPSGAASGGIVVTLRGTGIPSAPDVGCFFGTEAENVFVRATSFTKSYVACVAPPVVDLPKPPERSAAGYAVSVRVGTSASGVAAEFGELFVYTMY
jgi:Leucine-rich repeat (LRR) protein